MSIKKCLVVRCPISIPKGLISSTAMSPFACSLLNMLRPKSAGDWPCQRFQEKHKVENDLTLLQRGAQHIICIKVQHYSHYKRFELPFRLSRALENHPSCTVTYFTMSASSSSISSVISSSVSFSNSRRFS